MKTMNLIFKSFVAFTFVCSATTTFTSCKNDSDEIPTEANLETRAAVDSLSNTPLANVDVPQYDKSGEMKFYTLDQWADEVYGPDGANGDEEMQEAKAAFKQKCKEEAEQWANQNGMNGICNYFGKKAITYTSVDENGQPVKLSCLVCWGQYAPVVGGISSLFTWALQKFANVSLAYTPKQNHIHLVCPYTHSKENECATGSMNALYGGWETKTSFTTNLMIIPDGEGFGENKNHDQPYLNHNLQARQLYDALIVGFDYYIKELGGKMEDDWTLRVMGMSQGAGDAIAVHRLLDTQTGKDGEGLNKIWRFEYSNVCCGPYSPAKTMLEYYNDGFVNYPVVLPLTIKSMRAANPKFASMYPEERFYSDKYLKNCKAKLDDALLHKTLDAHAFNKELISLLFPKSTGQKILDTFVEVVGHRSTAEKLARDITGDMRGAEAVNLEDILSAEALNPDSQLYKDFMECLKDQELTTGWTPKTKTYIYCSTKDDVVPYSNTTLLANLFGDKATVKNYKILGHVKSCQLWMLGKW